MTRHIIGITVLLISILVLPYWIYIPLLFVALIFIPFFWEGILFAFLIDTIYSGKIETISLLFSPFALIILLTLIILLPIKERLRLHV